MSLDLVKLVENKNLFQENEPIIVALSGGIDSMVLFDILSKLNHKIVIAHVNHNKRQESIDEYLYIEKMAKEKGIPFEGYSIIDDAKTNFHHDARLKRYEFFRAIAQKHKSKKIAVAHHLDDQVETILMRIVRGTSFSGYSGIKEIRIDRNVAIIRPLMDIKKHQILAYAKKNKVQYFDDATNKEDMYTRNRFRNNIIPLLQEENPNLDQKIIQLAEYIDSANEVLEQQKDQFLKEFSMYNHISLEAFNKLPQAIKIKVIQHLVNSTSNDTVEVSYEQYKAITLLCQQDTPNQELSLSNGYRFVKEYEVIFVEKEKPIQPTMIEVNKEGEYFVDDNKSYIFTSHKIAHNYSNYFELCYNKLVFPLYIRNRKNGDKISLKIGTKKVKDIFIDQKIPKSKRDAQLVIANNQEVIWIPGIKKSIQNEDNTNKLYIYEVE